MPQNNHFGFQQLPFVDAIAMDERSGNDNHNPYWNMRERLFQVVFERMTMAYAIIVPVGCRKFIEYVYLSLALLSLSILIYIHIAFIQSPVNCLAHVSKDWPRDGILRVEIKFSDNDLSEYDNDVCSYKDLLPSSTSSAEDRLLFYQNNFYRFSDDQDKLLHSEKNKISVKNESFHINSLEMHQKCLLKNKNSEINVLNQMMWPEQEYVVEYSLEYGFLKLSSLARQNINIPVLTVVLDSQDKKCFGNSFSQLLLKYVVGYSDVLMSSLKNLVDKDENKGFVRNVVTGEQYRFVNKTLTWMSYVSAAFIMMVFTLSISMLLRYSHHQIFLFIVELLHVLEFNLHASFPAAPLLTVVLALVGMEAIMSEFFNDTTTAFYIILIVWIADQYDTIFCRAIITRRHWLRFFYLYHFAFYAYDYRFNGQYSKLALCTSCLFIQHSMIYFFHHYELPAVTRNNEDVMGEIEHDVLPPVEHHSVHRGSVPVATDGTNENSRGFESGHEQINNGNSDSSNVTCSNNFSCTTSNFSSSTSDVIVKPESEKVLQHHEQNV